MPWLEVPEWRAWESYAAPMSDSPIEHDPDLEAGNGPLPGEGLVITGTINIALEGADVMPLFPSEVEPPPPPTDADDTTDDAELVGPEPEHLPANLGEYVTPPPLDHHPPVESEERRQRRLAKESMSRSERLANGW